MKTIEHFGSGKVAAWLSSSFSLWKFCDGCWRNWLLTGLFFFLQADPGAAQVFDIATNPPPFVSNGAFVITFPSAFPSLPNSYYVLTGANALSNQSPFSPLGSPNTLFGPTYPAIGNGDYLNFAPQVSPSGSMFYQVEQLSLTSTNSIIRDGIADGFKLLHTLPVFGPSQAAIKPLGSTNTWLGIYRNQTNLAALPLAYFPNPSATFVVGVSNVAIQVAFTKPFTGRVTYQLSGTAIPSSTGVVGDYIAPAGNVFINNSTTANITITLVPEPDIEINRSIVVALSAPPLTSQTYTITTNSCVATIQIVQSTNGVFIGTLNITNGLLAGAQSVKMALRPGAGSSTMALLDVTGNALLGSTFAITNIPVAVGTNGFQLNGGQFASVVTNTPWGRNLTNYLSFGPTQSSDGTTFTTPVAMSLSGLTASGISYPGSGTLTLTRSQ